MKKKIKNIGFGITLLSTTIFTGCGGGGSSLASTTINISEGQFIDAPVKGIRYETNSHSGYTDSNGTFKYIEGETVKFTIGSIELGSANAKSIITPMTLAGDAGINSISTKAKNIARLLQSLDNNSSNNSIIVIPNELNDINLTSINIDAEADLNTILTQANTLKPIAGGYQLINSTIAVKNMKDYLISNIIDGDYEGTITNTGGSSNSCIKSSEWQITVNTNSISGKTLNNDMITGEFNDGTINGTSSDGTSWAGTVNENGIVSGTYDYNNGECLGTLSGKKRIAINTNELLDTYNSKVFKKYNNYLELLPEIAKTPTNSIISSKDWVISKKDNTSFYVSENTSTSQLLTHSEAVNFCSALSLGGLNWRLPTNNEALVIGELHPIDAFIWTSNITDIVFSQGYDSVNLQEQFVCQKQYYYNTKTQEGLWQQYCNESLTGKFAACVADIN